MAGKLAGWQGFILSLETAAPDMPEHTNAPGMVGETSAGTKQELGVGFSWAALREGLWQHQSVITGVEEAKGTWHRGRINLDPFKQGAAVPSVPPV